MLQTCPYCLIDPSSSGGRTKCIGRGIYFRKSDGQSIKRFRCTRCKKGFSRATLNPCFGQNKRQVNYALRGLFASSVSLRRAARLLNLNRKTVVRKLLFLSQRAKLKFDSDNLKHKRSHRVQFDELETFEHTKCKPLSVALAVEH